MYFIIALLTILIAPVLPQETPEVTALPQTTTDIETPICTQKQQNAFLSTLPSGAVCSASLETVSSPPLHHPQLLDIAFDNLCTKDCGGAYVHFQESTCEDEIAAEGIRLFCTRSNGTAAVGEYCRFALADILDPSILNSFDFCENSTSETPCPPGCKDALIKVKHEMGCCYQNVYNNTLCINNSLLLSAGLIIPKEFATLRALNNPAGNPWIRCGVEPPSRCSPPDFKPHSPSKCNDQSDAAFVAFLPFPETCGSGLETVFNPPTNDSLMLASALEDVCLNNCGGVYANYRKSVCDDELESESLRIFCTLTDGSAAVGTHCRYAVADILDGTLFDQLFSCYNITPNSPCPSDCRNGLLNLKAQIGCCYQSIYNNTLYLTELFKAGILTAREFIGFDNLNNPAGNPWTLCEVEPPKHCEQPPFTLPPTPMKCSLPDQRVYILTIPDGITCGNAIGVAYLPPANDSRLLSNAVDDLCTNKCGGVYTNYQENVCKDELGAESVRVFCSPTCGTATVGSFCYYATVDMLYPSLLTSLLPCYNNKSPCSSECWNALTEIKSRIGCCYQTVYNNTVYNTLLLEAGFITQYEFNEYQGLNNPASNPWIHCNIDPPPGCELAPFKPPSAPRCTLDDQISFVSTLLNAAVCGPSIATVFSPPQNNPLTLTNALRNVCTNECGGIYTNYLESVCNDELAAESLRLFCTQTNSSAAVGDYCRYVVADILGTSLLDALTSCYDSTTDEPCVDDCRAALLNLKTQMGCCYQNIYNNTEYNTQLLYAGLVTSKQFTGLFDLNIPSVNPWTLCDIEPPHRCDSPPFQPPLTPNCTMEDSIGFLLSLPRGHECNDSLQIISLLSTDNPMTLTSAFDNACTNDCGGKYANYLENVCNDHFGAENTRLYCVQSNGSAEVGPYCRHALFDVLDPSLFMALATCSAGNSSEDHCTAECREGLINLKAAIGCCYQNVYNNTPYFVQLLHAGIITPSFFTQFIHFNDPISNRWRTCGVKTPQHCTTHPFSDGCPPGTYLENLKCQRCPANANTTLTGGNVTQCPCLNGYFRSSQDRLTQGCSSPPSACRNIQAAQITDTQIILRWKRPIKTGRNDFYYTIEYNDGETTGKHTILNQMEYVEQVLSNLKPDTMYTFTVTVENGVSEQDTRRKDLRSCKLMTTTMEGRPSPPHGAQTFCSAVGWRMPLNPNGKIIGYDVQLMGLGDGNTMLLSVESDSTFSAIHNDYQILGTTVQIRAKTSAGAGNWSQKLSLGCLEMPTPTCPPCNDATPPTQGVYFTLAGQLFGNNSRVSMDSVGEGERDALICRTDRTDCCGTVPNRFGQFYYPSGVQVPIKSAGQGFYRNRGDQLIRLNRREGTDSPTGRYRCEIPEASGEMQNLYISLI